MDHASQNMCELLDAFLDGELSAADAARFEAHSLQCDGCREAAAQQRWLDAALRADEIAGRTAPAAMLTAAADAIVIVQRKQRVRRMLAGGLAAAASVALVAAWQLREPPVAPGSAGRSVTMPVDVVQREATPRRSRGLQEDVPTSVKGVATFTAGGNGIAIPVASESPDVTIVQFYSTTEADRRLRRQRELEAKYRELIGG
jgi:predicted anti-sigma-YlaC factor YlaD